MARLTVRLKPSGRIMPQVMSVPDLACMAVSTGRLMLSERIMSQIKPGLGLA
jgi:hypothetical protein